MKRHLLFATLVCIGCSSSKPPEEQPKPRQEEPARTPKQADPPPTTPKQADPPPTTRPPVKPATQDDPRAVQKAVEKGRIALVVDLIVRSKSFDRGFESALLFIPDMRDGVTQALIEGAANRDSRGNERCLEALGAMGRLRLIPDYHRKSAVETVARRVRTEKAPAAWSAAVEALGALAGRNAGQDVTDALARALDEDAGAVVRSCAEVLGDAGYREAVPALVVALNRARDRYAWRALVRALGRLGGKEAARRLVEALNAADAADREAAAAALGDAGGPDAAAALRAAIERPEEAPTVRRAAITALERMGGEDAKNAIKTALDDLSGRREEMWVVITRDLSETLERIQRK